MTLGLVFNKSVNNVQKRIFFFFEIALLGIGEWHRRDQSTDFDIVPH